MKIMHTDIRELRKELNRLRRQIKRIAEVWRDLESDIWTAAREEAAMGYDDEDRDMVKVSAKGLRKLGRAIDRIGK